MPNLSILVKKIIYFHELGDYYTCYSTIVENEDTLLENFPQFFVEVLKIYYNMLLGNYDKISLESINRVIDDYTNIDDNNNYKIVVNLVLLKYAYYKIQEEANFKQSSMYSKIYSVLTTSPHSLHILEKLIKRVGIESVNNTSIHLDYKNIHIESLINLFDCHIFSVYLNYMMMGEIDE